MYKSNIPNRDQKQPAEMPAHICIYCYLFIFGPVREEHNEAWIKPKRLILQGKF